MHLACKPKAAAQQYLGRGPLQGEGNFSKVSLCHIVTKVEWFLRNMLPVAHASTAYLGLCGGKGILHLSSSLLQEFRGSFEVGPVGLSVSRLRFVGASTLRINNNPKPKPS